MATPTTITTAKTVNINSYYIGSTYDSANIDSSYPISNGYAGSDSTTYAKIPLTQGSNAETSFIYSFASLSSIPSNATINSVTCSAKLGISTTSSKAVTARTVQLCTGPSGSTLMGSASTVGSGSSVYSLTTGTWTRSQLTSAKLRLYAKRGTSGTSSVYYFVFYGATLSVNYTFEGYQYQITVNSAPIDIGNNIETTYINQYVTQGNDANAINITNPWGYTVDIVDNGIIAGTFSDTTYAYTLTNVQADHNISFKYHTSLYNKIDGLWQPAVNTYVKTNGTWVKQLNLNTPFTSNKYYKDGKNVLFNECPNLVKFFSNLSLVKAVDVDVIGSSGTYGLYINIYKSSYTSYDNKYTGPLTDGETYYIYATCPRDQQNHEDIFCIYELIYTNSTTITLNKLFEKTQSGTSLNLRIMGSDPKQIQLYTDTDGTNISTFACGSMYLFKKSPTCTYSYSELNNIISNATYDRFRGNYDTGTFEDGYAWSMRVVFDGTPSSSEFYPEGYYIIASKDNFSLLYISVDGTNHTVNIYPIDSNVPDNPSFCRNLNSWASTYCNIGFSIDGTNTYRSFGIQMLQILPNT